ncbi:hypothetical protein G0Q06_04845 [Puniceicoccales bacterium CK1056]|uniref:Uncharacterized protein n=1 Tax=Oceanipulchritudo coccoides TaxID=2706888 RepID=A0A6B2LYL0_9BACT|nr:hypothetical protein [Oceanipulchritudo coccoides]NDV61771.1 hypothetical protein [Oceanipulchritudo coccoides]
MRRNLLTLLLGCACLCSHADITIQVIAIPATGAFLQADESALPDGSIARVGYFDEAGLSGLDASGLRNFGTLDALFTEVTSFPSRSGNIQGNTNVSVSTAGGVGRRIYLWIYNGGNPESATQSGIFTDPNWTVPSDLGSLNMVSSAIDEADIVLGTVVPGGYALEEMGDGSEGLGLEALFETKKNLDGTFTSSWFGTYSDLGSRWIYDSARGVLYVNNSSTREDIFLYSISLASWVWTSRDTYPILYSYSSGTWLHVFEVNGAAYLFDYAAGDWQL